MASANAISNLAFLIFLLKPWSATCNFLTPILPPIFDDVCKEVECGKGSCKPALNSTFFFVCECEPGWKQARPDDDDYFKFLPCLIPDCNLNYACTKVPSPLQEKEEHANESFFDPCHWTECGGGTCKKISPLTHKCECKEGYNNLLNITAFPCFKECALGPDCSRLGISERTFSPPNSSLRTDNVSNQVTTVNSSYLKEGINWWIITIISLALVLSK
ncbi:hypothetical protein LguiA_030961 [Lonicera macranthoides]